MKCDYVRGSCTNTATKFYVSIRHYGSRVRCICVLHSGRAPFYGLQEFNSYEDATAALAMRCL